jgi:hypothetical protein
VQRWQDSGLTAREFASEMGVKATTSTFWKWRLKKDQEADGSKPATRTQLARRKVSRSIQLQLGECMEHALVWNIPDLGQESESSVRDWWQRATQP